MSDANVPENRMRAGDQERDDVLVALQRAYEAGRLRPWASLGAGCGEQRLADSAFRRSAPTT